MNRILKLAAACAGVALLASCGPETNHHQAVYVLIDTSGSYTREIAKAQAVVNFVLGNIQPGDSLAVGRVKSRSFTEKDIVAKVTLAKDPIQANLEKRSFSESMARFAGSVQATSGSRYTDITGGVIQAAEFLNETGAGRKMIIIFSDMQEELDTKTVRDIPIKLQGIRMIALNVTKLSTDNTDPRRYLGRLEWWQKRALDAGATEWHVVNDLDHMDRIFSTRG